MGLISPVFTGQDRYGLLRFDISGISGSVLSATLTLSLYSKSTSGDRTVGVYPCLTDWGVTDTDGGATENPATGGQATWDNAKDYGSGSDVGWADGVGAGFSSNDYGAQADTFVVDSADAEGATYTADVTTMVQDWNSTPANNSGIVLALENGLNTEYVYITSQENSTAANRPILTVVTSGGGGATGSSVARQKSSTSVGIGIGV